jgi:uncharacterized protein YxeA
MKKVLMLALAVLISVAFATGTFAQAPAGTSEQTTTTTTSTTVTKSKPMTFTGKVTNLDTAASTMIVKGKKGDMTFDVSGAKMKEKVKAGSNVTVRYMEKDGKMMASSVTMRHAAKTTKTTTTKTTETKEETPAPAK